MQQLEAREFHRVLPVIEASMAGGGRAGWGSVLEGRQPGAVFVDDPIRPQMVLIGHHGWGTFFPFGNPQSPAFHRFLRTLRAEQRPAAPATFRAPSLAWQEALDPLLAGKAVRISFDFQPSTPAGVPEWRSSLPPEGRVIPIDRSLAESLDHALGSWFTRVWGSVDGFLTHGFGFCLQLWPEDGRPARFISNCRAAAVGGGEAEIQVSTWGEEHQRRGYAGLVCAAFIERCADLGLKPYWACDPDNAGSIGLAEKLGFVRAGEIVQYRL